LVGHLFNGREVPALIRALKITKTKQVIVGIGIDMTCVSRLEKDMKNRPADFENVFTPDEVIYCCQSEDVKYERFAARFAAKEAFIKANAFLERTFSERDDQSDYFRPVFREIEVVMDSRGRPEIRVHGKTQEALKKLKGIKWWVSVTHEADLASAVVVLEKI